MNSEPEEFELNCRVCGFEYDDENAPWRQVEGQWFPSYEICVCCNVQFGYEDVCENAVRAFREKWISEGGKFNYKPLMPKDWSLQDQLRRIPPKWRDREN